MAIKIKWDNFNKLAYMWVFFLILIAALIQLEEARDNINESKFNYTINNQTFEVYSTEAYALKENPLYVFGKAMLELLAIISAFALLYNIFFLCCKVEFKKKQEHKKVR